MDSSNKVLMVFLAIVLPPLAVYLKEGSQVTENLWINVVLWVFTGGIGGVIHALWLILR
jgi:uncharacterized membrane protein YqaE (UPF0057 family)